MGETKTEVWQGTLALMVLTTLDTLGEQHGYGIARRIEQTSGDRLALNPGTLYPTLLKLEQEGYIESSGAFGQQPARALLSADTCRQETAAARTGAVGAGQRHHGALSRSSEASRLTRDC